MLFQTSLGIDIENDCVSMAYLKASFKGVGLAAHVIHPLDREQTAKERLGRVRELVRDFLEKNKISSTDIFLGIPRDLVILRTLELPLAVKENLRESLGYEIEKYVPFSVDDIHFDYQIITEDRQVNILKILLLVVRKESIAPYLELRNALGDGISGIEISSTAMVNYFSSRPNTPDGNTYALVYLRADDLELNLIEEGLLNYSRSVRSTETGGNLSSLIIQELKPLREGMGQDGGRLKVAFCGPDADVEGLKPLKERADLDIRPVDLAGEEIPSYTLIPAYGLALNGLQKTPMDINLMPIELRKRPNKTAYYVMFVLVTLLILLVLSWEGGNILRQRLNLNRLNTEIKRLGVEISNIDRIQMRCNELEYSIDFLNSLRGGRVPVLNVLRDLSQRIPETAWVRSFNFSDDVVRIEGYAESASELIPLLEGSPLFSDAAFQSTITKGKDGKERFRIGLKVN